MHSPLETQFVVRAVPPTISVEPGPGLVGIKFPPKTCSVKLPTPPAVALAGSRLTMVIAFVMVTLALPARDVSSELVATMLIAFGEGVEIGAVKFPLASIVPHGKLAALHAVPVTFQVTV